MSTSSSPIAFQWRTDPEDEGVYGEGISRPRNGARTKEYRLLIYPSGARPMLWITRAENVDAAIRYAQNRWPSAEIEVAS
jgi:hypothetical protein